MNYQETKKLAKELGINPMQKKEILEQLIQEKTDASNSGVIVPETIIDEVDIIELDPIQDEVIDEVDIIELDPIQDEVIDTLVERIDKQSFENYLYAAFNSKLPVPIKMDYQELIDKDIKTIDELSQYIFKYKIK